VENAKGNITGIVSSKDIVNYRKQNSQIKDALVTDCMTQDIVTITPETSLEKAEKVMLINEFGSLPVVRDDCVIGIITAEDIRALQRKLDAEAASA
jgi:CBS domain-containing protein